MHSVPSFRALPFLESSHVTSDMNLLSTLLSSLRFRNHPLLLFYPLPSFFVFALLFSSGQGSWRSQWIWRWRINTSRTEILIRRTLFLYSRLNLWRAWIDDCRISLRLRCENGRAAEANRTRRGGDLWELNRAKERKDFLLYSFHHIVILTLNCLSSFNVWVSLSLGFWLFEKHDADLFALSIHSIQLSTRSGSWQVSLCILLSSPTGLLTVHEHIRLPLSICSVSDTAHKDPASDTAGPFLRSSLESHPSDGFRVVVHAIVPDEPGVIQSIVRKWIDQTGVTLCITTGGTGFGIRDSTREVRACSKISNHLLHWLNWALLLSNLLLLSKGFGAIDKQAYASFESCLDVLFFDEDSLRGLV